WDAAHPRFESAQLLEQLLVHRGQDAASQRTLQLRLVLEVAVHDGLGGAGGPGYVLHRHIAILPMDEVPGHVEQLGTSLRTVAGPTGRSAVHGGLRRRIHGTEGIKYRRFYVKCSAEDPAASPAHEDPRGSASGRSDHVDHEEVHLVTHPDFPRDALV